MLHTLKNCEVVLSVRNICSLTAETQILKELTQNQNNCRMLDRIKSKKAEVTLDPNMKSGCSSGHVLHINCICFVCLFAAEVHGTENPLTRRPPLNPWMWQKSAIEQHLHERKTKMKLSQRVSQVRTELCSCN